LENRGSKDDEVSREMWKVVETSAREIRMEKTEEGRSKRESRKKMGGKRKEEEAEKGKDGRSKENSRRVGNLGQRREGSEIRDGGKKVGAK